MKKILAFICLFALIFAFGGCYLPPGDYGDVTVTLHYGNGNDSVDFSVNSGSTVATPKSPEREGYVFRGWSITEDGKTPFDFSTSVTSDVNLYAIWEIDVSDLANRIAAEALPGCVRIRNRQYSTGFMGMVTKEAYSFGSGVIYDEAEGYYYCLTNEHVISTDVGYQNSAFSVFDSYGNEHSATLVYSNKAYDLAILRFAPTRELKIMPFADADAEVGALSVSVGNPDGVINSVTYGKVLQYKALGEAAEEEIQVAFAVGWQDTPIDNGSSGGPVFNGELKVIGINFAGGTNADGEFVAAYFVPISRVKEFLSLAEVSIE